MGNYPIQISIVNKSSNKPIKTDDIDAMTIDLLLWATSMLNIVLWHSRCLNGAGNILLYNHALNDDDIVTATDSSTFFKASSGYRHDVLDIALVRLPQLSRKLVNLN